MKNRKLIIRIICIVLAAIFILSLVLMVLPAGAQASSAEIQGEIDDLNDQKSEIQGQMDEIQSEIDSLEYEQSNTLAKKAILDQKNQLAQEELDVIQEQIDIIDGHIAGVQQDLTAARAEEAIQRERWLTRVRAMEESSDVDYLQVIFNSTSFSDLLTRMDLVGDVMGYDEQLEAEYVAARLKVEELEARAEQMYADNQARRGELETKKAQLETDIDAACALIASIEENTDDYRQVMAAEEQTLADTTSLISQKEKELKEAQAREEAARLAELARQQAAQQQQAPSGGSSSSSSGSSSGGTAAAPQDGSAWMIWPSYTSRITSQYGMRVNPVTGIYKLHSGVDIGCNYGSNIWAAAAGTVISAGDNGSYGNCVMINHGNGYTTLYAHMSSIAVSVGQSVSQGQVVGYCGATGNVTGAHLHFEVRISSSGATINPMAFSYY